MSYFAGNNNLHKTLCVYLSGLGLTVLLTNSVKLYVGYLRPIFYDVCEADEAYEECTSGEDRRIRLSFPSGHASLSFCGFTLLSFYLERRLGVSRLRLWMHDRSSGQIVMGHKKPVRFARVVSILCYFPMVFAGFIAASRVVDNKHFPADVVGGSVLGVAIASLVHSIW
jgi:diacylglycerol diphosphate phosphatase/phosphatidate phosphatase